MTSTAKTALLAITATALATLLIVPQPASAACQCRADLVINCGHRGTGPSAMGAPFPENTIPSLQQAAIEGADMVEIDVIHSSDGVLILLHNDTLDKTTNSSGCAGALTVAELQALDAGAGTELEGMGVVIPTLAEVLDAVDIDINIELKIANTDGCPASDKPKMAADVVAAIQGDSKERRLIVSSFDAEVLSEIKALDATVYTGFLGLFKNQVQLTADAGFDALNLLAPVVDEEVMAQAEASGIELNVWTENDPERMKELIDLGVNMIITDDPDVLVTAAGEYCATAECDDTGPTTPAADGGCSIATAPADDPQLLWWLVLVSLALLTRRAMLLSEGFTQPMR